MTERKIEHPLRTITLQYDESKQESPAEKKLIEHYIALHDSIETLRAPSNKMMYEYSEHDDAIAKAAIEIEPFIKGIDDIYNQAKAETTLNGAESLREIEDRMTEFLPSLTAFHESVINKLEEESDRLEKEDERIEELGESIYADIEEHDNLFAAVSDEDNSALDWSAFYDDEQELKGLFDDYAGYNEKKERIINRYSALINKLNAAYAQWDKIKLLMTEAYNDTGLLDCSLSESYANGTGDEKKKPLYLIQPGDKRILKFKNDMGILANSTMHTLIVSADIQVIKNGETAMLDELIMCLQHFPKLIEKYIFAIKVNIENDGIIMEDDEWKGHETPIKWYNNLYNVPCTVFFLQDHDARAYVLMGDLIGDTAVEEKDGRIALEGKNLEDVCNRMYQCCLLFYYYCHNTGFDPQTYIEALFAEFDLPFDLAEVKKEYEETVKKGIHFRVVKKGKQGN